MSYGPFRRLVLGLALALAPLAFACHPAWANCQLIEKGALAVTMQGMRALLPAKINGEDVRFVVDSGAFTSVITPPNADKFDLPRRHLGIPVVGVTGAAEAEMGTVKVLTLAGAPLPNMDFIISGNEVGQGAVGLLGQNILGLFDVEYDLAKGWIRMWSPQGCSGKADLAYWSRTGPESVINLDSDSRRHAAYTKGPVYVNGVRLTALFDTGAVSSIMSREAAKRAGIRPNDPGVIAAANMIGVGRGQARSWIATVKSFKIGDEEIRNTKMLFGEIEPPNADMLVGMDFFLAHHVFVSNQQHKLYLTYNGGPVFDLGRTSAAAAAIAAANTTSTPGRADPTDAAGFAQRGAAFAARNELAPALADFDKAIEAAPTVPDYVYQRGLIYMRNNQPLLAVADFDRTLTLKPNDVPALIGRATLRLVGRDTAHSVQDLEAADRLSARQDDVHIQIATLYAAADRPAAAAIDQYSVWIETHPQDARLNSAMNSRCWLRALTGVDLESALKDCNWAIRNSLKNATLFNSRGLVRLRLGDLDKAIADYDAALAINPKLAWSLYGRGLAKQRKGLTAEGAADIAAATALNPNLAGEAKKRGLAS